MLESRWQPFLPLFLLPFWPIAAFCTVHVGWSNRFCHALLNCFLSAEGAYTFLHVSMAVCSAPLLKFFFFFLPNTHQECFCVSSQFQDMKNLCADVCVRASVWNCACTNFFIFYHGFLFYSPTLPICSRLVAARCQCADVWPVSPSVRLCLESAKINRDNSLQWTAHLWYGTTFKVREMHFFHHCTAVIMIKVLHWQISE